MEKMREGGYNLGGEQSGHIIFLDHSTSGDGMLTAIQLAYIMKETGKKLSELASEVTLFPQVLVNVTSQDKTSWETNENIQSTIKTVEEELGADGRVLVRPSCTEPLIRVMVEAPTKELCETYAHRIATAIENELGNEK